MSRPFRFVGLHALVSFVILHLRPTYVAPFARVPSTIVCSCSIALPVQELAVRCSNSHRIPFTVVLELKALLADALAALA